MALIGTSSTWLPRRSTEPITSATAMIKPRLHQVKPTAAVSTSASSTPATTLATRWTALRIVWYLVAWMTSRAVSGASTGRELPGSKVASR